VSFAAWEEIALERSLEVPDDIVAPPLKAGIALEDEALSALTRRQAVLCAETQRLSFMRVRPSKYRQIVWWSRSKQVGCSRT